VGWAHVAYTQKDNSVWMVTGAQAGTAGPIQFDAASGRMPSTTVFAKTDSDPHGLVWHNDELYSCDAGIHAGWADDVSATRGSVFKIDLI
jgi:hypothetical protein